MSTEQQREDAQKAYEKEYADFWVSWEADKQAEIDAAIPGYTTGSALFTYEAQKERERETLEADWKKRESALGGVLEEEGRTARKMTLSPGLPSQTMLNPLFTGK